MILVLLGTQNNSFKRLLKEINRLKNEGIIKEKILVQAGYTKIEDNNKNSDIEVFDFVDSNKIQEMMKQAEYIITHGGVGSIVSGLKLEKKIIAVPRLKKYDEHVNDHQLEIVEEYTKSGYIIGIKDVSELEKAYRNLKNFKPNKFNGDNNKLVQMVEDFINK